MKTKTAPSRGGKKKEEGSALRAGLRPPDRPLMLEIAIRNMVTRSMSAGAVADRNLHNKYHIQGTMDALVEQATREIMAALPGAAFLQTPQASAKGEARSRPKTCNFGVTPTRRSKP